MPTDDSFDKWFILQSADAMASRSFTTGEIVDLHERGALKDNTVIYHRYQSRREALTVKELVAQARAKKK